MRRALKGFNWIMSRFAIILFILLFCISIYAITDMSRVYAEAENVMSELYAYKPVIDKETGKADFTSLRALNPDVVAWITLEGTAIDYPVLQGENNLTYMNRDVFGDFSLAGSIFLDTRNSSDLSDSYSLIYGHHMDDHLMFGDLDLYKDEDFFKKYRKAQITTDDGIIEYDIYAVMEIPDSVQEVFNPDTWKGDPSELAGFIKDNSLYVWDPAMGDPGENPEEIKIVALVTCASGHTGTRTVVFLVSRKPGEPKPDKKPDKPTQNDTTPVETGDPIFNSLRFWIVVMAASIILLLLIRRLDILHRRKS